MTRFNSINTIETKGGNGREGRFIAQANIGIEELNQLIERYNNAEGDNPKQLEILYEIYLKQRDMDYHLPQTLLGEYIPSTEYRKKIHHELFKEMQSHFKELNVTSLEVNSLKEKIKGSQKAQPPDNGTLSEILANMPPEKVEQMESILLKNAKNKDKLKEELAKLYANNEEGYVQWQEFIQNHSIEKLGGNNSVNFKIKNIESGNTFVLKVENRLDQPRDSVIDLSEDLQREILTSRVAERNGTERAIYITDFLPGGDLQSQASKEMDDTTRVKNSLTIFQKMGTDLQDITKAGYFFPDMKNSNWLLDGLTPKISDDKSFFPLDENGFIKTGDNWYRILATNMVCAPEMKSINSDTYSADKAHAYMLGKNLYNYLTQEKYNNTKEEKWYAPNIHNGKDFNFEDEVFKTEEGIALQELIEKLVKPKPEERIPVEEAVNQLRKIQELSLEKNYCRSLMEELKKYKCSKNKEELTLRSERLIEFDAEKDIEKIKETRSELEKVLENTLYNMKQFPEIKKDLEELISAREECNRVLEELKRNNHGNTDQAIDSLVQKYQTIIAEELNVDVLREIKTEIDTSLELKLAQNDCLDALEKYNPIQNKFEVFNQSLKSPTESMSEIINDYKQRILKTETIDSVKEIKEEFEMVLPEMEQTFLKLEVENIKNECKMIGESLKTYKFGDKDLIIDTFIQSKTQELNAAAEKKPEPDINTMQKIKNEFNETLSTMRDNIAIKALRLQIEALKNRGSKVKVGNIVEEMAKLTIEERSTIDNYNTYGGRTIQQELATHRNSSLLRQKLNLDHKGDIIVKQSPNSYKEWRSQMVTLREERQEKKGLGENNDGNTLNI